MLTEPQQRGNAEVRARRVEECSGRVLTWFGQRHGDGIVLPGRSWGTVRAREQEVKKNTTIHTLTFPKKNGKVRYEEQMRICLRGKTFGMVLTGNEKCVTYFMYLGRMF